MLLAILLLLIGSDRCVESLKNKQLSGLKMLLPSSEKILATCKLILFKELVDYTTAETRCKKFTFGGGKVAGNLATVNNEEKNTDIKFLLGLAYPVSENKEDEWNDDQWVWAGLRKTKNNDGKQHGGYNADHWEWADGSSPTDFEKWMEGQPDQRTVLENNVILYQNQMRINHAGKWDDTFVSKTHPYACDYQGKYIISSAYKSWSEARAACDAAGLVMAKVRDESEVNEITALAKHILGEEWNAEEFHASNWMWLGGNDKEEEGTWKWNDGEIIEWFSSTNEPKMPWRYPNPDNAKFLGNLTQNYLALSKLGEFDDSFDSNLIERPFACQCPEY